LVSLREINMSGNSRALSGANVSDAEPGRIVAFPLARRPDDTVRYARDMARELTQLLLAADQRCAALLIDAAVRELDEVLERTS
jgi:hypothetical protein